MAGEGQQKGETYGDYLRRRGVQVVDRGPASVESDPKVELPAGLVDELVALLDQIIKNAYDFETEEERAERIARGDLTNEDEAARLVDQLVALRRQG